jgi:hypothetical protein
MANFIKVFGVMVSVHLKDQAGSYDATANHNRPLLGINMYNPSETETVVVTIPPRTAAYLPSVFPNARYAKVETKFTKAHVTCKLPIGGKDAMFTSGKAQSPQ